MKQRIQQIITAVIVFAGLQQIFAQGTAFTYHGRLNQNGGPATGLYDLQFGLCDAATNGSTVAGPVTATATPVTNGLFIVTLDFGPGVFTGASRWLQLGVRTNGSAGDFTLLQPRQAVTPTPYAMFAPLASVAQSVPAGSISASALASNAVGESALSPTVLAKLNAFYAWQAQAVPVITSSNSVTAPAGYPFNFQITASNNSPFRFTASGLPGGLGLTSLDTIGDIAGTCNSTGSFPVTVTVANIAGSSSTNLSLTFVPSVPILDPNIQTNYSRYLHGNVQLDAVGFGFPIQYFWRKNGVLLTGQTNISLILTNMGFADTANYTALVTNYLGGDTAAIQLTVNNLAVWGMDANFNSLMDSAPATLTNVASAAAGGGIVALTSDARVFRWGGAGSDPVMSLTNLVAVAAGASHCLALRTNGTVLAWGDNSNGQTNVPAGATGVVALAANGDVSAALKSDGTLVMWGTNDFDPYTPPANATNVYAVAKGDLHTVAMRGDGSVLAWGDNTFNQTNVPAGLTNVVAIAAGVGHSLALLNNGTVTGWGDTNALNAPAGLSNVVAIAAGDTISVALKADGTLTWWGDPGNIAFDGFPSDLSHVVAISAAQDAFSALINDARTLTVTGKVSTAFSYQIQPTGKSKYFALGLPSGLTVNTTNGAISGTPTKAGTWSVFLGTRTAVTNAAQVLSFQISP
ncbi:MAG TPA: putative Ig domain-containing protein [Verrucomicrobiae bacterium]